MGGDILIWNKKGIKVLVALSLSFIAAAIFISSLLVNYKIYNTLCLDALDSCLFTGQLSGSQADTLHEVGLSLQQYSIFKLFNNFVQTIGYLIIGFVLLWIKPKNRVSLSAALILISLGLGYSIDNLQMLHPNFWFVFSMIGFLSNMYIIFFYIYPDGKLYPRWTVPLGIIWAIISLGRNLFPGSLFDPFTWPPAAEATGWIGFHLSAIVIQFVKYRLSTDKQQKQQIKWLIYGFSVTLLAIAFISLIEHVGTQDIPVIISNLLIDFLLSLAALFLPVTLLIAILFYRLWNIDLLVKKTFVYGTLIAISISFYIIIVGTLNTLLQTQGNYIISLIAAGLLAVTFQPLQQKIDKSVHKLIYGDRETPYQVFTRIGKQYNTSRGEDTVIHAILETILDSLKFPYVAVRFQNQKGKETEEHIGNRAPFIERITLIYRNQTLGILLIGNDEPFSKREKKLISVLAHHVSIAVYAHIITQEVVLSRNQILSAREEERRKLRHDLHDSIGPSLATIKLLAEAAQDSERRNELLEQIQTQTQHTLNTIREIVEALRPTEIDQLGLRHTLENFVNHLEIAGIKAQFDAPDIFPVLPAAMEVAIYRITQEAVHNVIKHSGSDYCLVKLKFDHYVSLIIQDNGTGIKKSNTNGIGLNSMKERALENGGALEIETTSNVGTSILAKFPYLFLEG